MRRENDWYPTPSWATQELLARVTIAGDVLEPCAGDGAIVAPLLLAGLQVRTNDLDRNFPAQSHEDATDPRWWKSIARPAWVVTNPPFSAAPKILPLAFAHATRGVAMLLRLSYLEPCEGRGAWLAEHPPDGQIVLPRISFTGDGDTDSVTCAWMLWGWMNGSAIQVALPVDQRQSSLYFSEVGA